MQRRTPQFLREIAQIRQACVKQPYIRSLSTLPEASRPCNQWSIVCRDTYQSPRYIRSFSSTFKAHKGISPESDDPKPREPLATPQGSAAPAELTNEEYHQLSDEYMDAIEAKLEELQEEREDVDLEYSVCASEFPAVSPFLMALLTFLNVRLEL